MHKRQKRQPKRRSKQRRGHWQRRGGALSRTTTLVTPAALALQPERALIGPGATIYFVVQSNEPFWLQEMQLCNQRSRSALANFFLPRSDQRFITSLRIDDTEMLGGQEHPIALFAHPGDVTTAFEDMPPGLHFEIGIRNNCRFWKLPVSGRLIGERALNYNNHLPLAKA